jgi:hypothetical protein
MFHKFSKHNFKQTYSNLKHQIVHGYHHVKNIAHNIDYGVSVAKHIYEAFEPVLREHGQHHLHGNALKAISGYENLRNQALDANHHITTIGHKLSGLV